MSPRVRKDPTSAPCSDARGLFLCPLSAKGVAFAALEDETSAVEMMRSRARGHQAQRPSPEAPEGTLARCWLQRRRRRSRGAETAPHFSLMCMGWSARFDVSSEGQQSKLMGSIEKIFVREASWFGHHGVDIVHRVDAAAASTFIACGSRSGTRIPSRALGCAD